MSLPVFVINLPEQHARRQLMQLQLDALGFDTVIWPAVDGRRMSPEERAQHYDGDKAQKLNRALTAGEIACSLSHLGIYRHMLERDLAHALVLEDDAAIGRFALPVVQQVESLLQTDKPTVVMLSRLARFVRRGSRSLTSLHRLVPVWSARGSHAYMLNRAAARTLVEGLYPVFTQADSWSGLRSFPVALWGVDPYCVGRSVLAGSSSLAPERSKLRAKKPRTPIARLRAMRRRFFYRLVLKPLYGFTSHDSNW